MKKSKIMLKKMLRMAHQELWDKQISTIGPEIYDRQALAYKLMRQLNKQAKDTAPTSI